MQDSHFDVVVVGGGMVGAALACGLAQQQFRVAVIERAEPAAFDAASPPDVRISAIGASSVAMFGIACRRCAARLIASSKPGSGKVRM